MPLSRVLPRRMASARSAPLRSSGNARFHDPPPPGAEVETARERRRDGAQVEAQDGLLHHRDEVGCREEAEEARGAALEVDDLRDGDRTAVGVWADAEAHVAQEVARGISAVLREAAVGAELLK